MSVLGDPFEKCFSRANGDFSKVPCIIHSQHLFYPLCPDTSGLRAPGLLKHLEVMTVMT